MIAINASPIRLLIVFVCITSTAVAIAEEARWWKEIPDEVVFAVGPDFSRVQPQEARVSGTLRRGDVDGVPALIAVKHINSTITVPQPALASPFSIEATVRFAPSTIVELFTTNDPGSTGDCVLKLSVTVNARQPFEASIAPYLHGGNLITQAMHNPAGRLANLEITSRVSWVYDRRQYERYSLRPDTKRWPETVRDAHESELSVTPNFFSRWTRLRIECANGKARFYVDSRFVVEASCTDPGKSIGVRLRRGCALRSFTAQTIPQIEERFYPIDLQGHLNSDVVGKGADAGDGASLGARSLPQPGLCEVAGTPFRLSVEGDLDAVDVGKSLWRWGRNSMSRYAQRCPSALYADPRKAKLAAPNRFYSELRLICFSDTAPGQTRRLTTRLYEPPFGYAADFETEIPTWEASSGGDCLPLPVQVRRAGRSVSGRLWLCRVPIDPCSARDFIADPARPSLHIELTKAVELTRSYPDPFVYDRYAVGLPSAAHVLAATLVRTPVEILVEPDRPCWLFERPETPFFNIRIRNCFAPDHTAHVTLEARELYGATASRSFDIDVGKHADMTQRLHLPVKQDGHYRLVVRVSGPGYDLSWPSSFVMLPADTRRARGWQSPFGVWRAHHRGMPVNWHVAFDRRVGIRWAGPHPDGMSAKLIHEAWLTPAYARGLSRFKFDMDRPDWGIPPIIEEARNKLRFERPKASLYNLFWESAVSHRLSVCVPPRFMGMPKQEMDEEEKARFDAMWDLAISFGKLVREELPEVEPRFKSKKIAFGNASAQFILPFIERGFPKAYIDFFGLDIPFFERMPERPPRAVELNQLYFLKQTAKQHGYDDVPLCGTEYMAYPSVPGALTEYEDACYTVRNFTIAMSAYNMQYFFSASCPAQAGNWYGRQHYGGSGYLRRAPALNPELSTAAYATYTRIFDGPRHDTWAIHPTGSLSAFAASCLRRYRAGRCLAMWTIRGHRPVTLTLKRETGAIVTRMSGQSTRVASRGKRLSVTLRPAPVYVELQSITNPSDIAGIELGPARHDERPAAGIRVLDRLNDSLDWHPLEERRLSYETNKVTQPRFRGRIDFKHVRSSDRRGMGLKCVLLPKQEHDPKIAPLYTILRHSKGGIPLPGQPTKIGWRCRGNSSWARIIPVLQDAKGERWTFIGNPLKGKYKAEADQNEITTKGGEGWNSEDVHSWSAVNFDGWRYMELELPTTFPGDLARGPSQVWWRDEGGDNLVDYPLKLVELIIEMYTGVIYMGEWVPIEGENAIEIDEIVVAYDDPFAGKWEE